MKPLSKFRFARMPMKQQRGVVLFFALIALLAMSLAAVALIRSVDTSTIIAGNLAFKRSATMSGDAGVERGITWLAATDTANSTVNIYQVQTHPFNNDGGTATFPNVGYYSSVAPNLSLTDSSATSHIKWDGSDSNCNNVQDSSGNTVCYVIQRMCRTANTLLGPDCLFSGVAQSNSSMAVVSSQGVCNGPGCSVPSQAPLYRITSRSTGPKLTISYIQAFVY